MNRMIRAFTLVELLLALAITSILVVLLVNVVSAALAVWQQGRNQIDTFATARQTLDRIADEIKGATAAANQIEFSENVPSLQGTTSPVPGVSENIFFVAPYPNLAAGDLCVIAYRHNADTHELQRAFLDSNTSWTPASNRYRAAGYGSLTWRTVAQGILEFEIQSYSQQDLDQTPTATPPPSWNSVAGDPNELTMIGNPPRQVVLRIKVVDDRALVKLAGLLPGDPTYDRIVTSAAREFKGSVTLLPPH